MRRIEAVRRSTRWNIYGYQRHPATKYCTLGWALLLLHVNRMITAIDEGISEQLLSLGNLALTYGGRFMIPKGLDILYFSSVALIVALGATFVKRHRGVPKFFQAEDLSIHKQAGGHLFKGQRRPVLKPCPSCAAQLPLSAIMCDTCDYNFLAERPGRGQALLEPPRPFNQDGTEQRIAAAGVS